MNYKIKNIHILLILFCLWRRNRNEVNFINRRIIKLLLSLLVFILIISLEPVYATSWQYQQVDKLSIAILSTKDNKNYALGLVANSRANCKANFFITKFNVKYPLTNMMMKVNHKNVKFKKYFQYQRSIAYKAKTARGDKYLQSQLTTSNNLKITINNTIVNFEIDEFLFSYKKVVDTCKTMKKEFQEAL